MTIDEKNEKIGAIDQIQNQYFMDKGLNSEQKDARGIITFLEKQNITYDWGIYCVLNSEMDKSYSLNQATKIYHEKISGIRNEVAKVLNLPVSDLNSSRIECIDGKSKLTFKEGKEIKKDQIQVFSKMGKMYNDGILDDITCNMLLTSVTELYGFYENKHQMPIEQYQMMVKSK